MKNLLTQIKVQVQDGIYLKDPETSELGRKIVEHGILLIDELGFEDFTFKKLGQQIGSNESSIYRYFENKHKFLLYITSWYWGWMEYLMAFHTNGVPSNEQKLRESIHIVTFSTKIDYRHSFINIKCLYRIVTSEFSKSYLTKMVDQENHEGYFMLYKSVVHRLAVAIEQYCQSYPFAKSLASTVIEGALHQHFLSRHLPTISNVDEQLTTTEFFEDMVFRVLQPTNTFTTYGSR